MSPKERLTKVLNPKKKPKKEIKERLIKALNQKMSLKERLML